MDDAWNVALELPRRFTPVRIVPRPGGRILLGGYLGTATEAHDKRRALLLVAGRTPGTPLHTAFDRPGWITGLDVAEDGVGWATRAVPAADGGVPRMSLLGTTDGGDSWEQIGRIPVASVSCLLAAGSGEIWILGASGLHASGDGGASWQQIDAPGDRAVPGERLFRAGERVLLAGPECVYVTRDGGGSWGRRDVHGVHVRAVHGPWIAARGDGETLLGRPSGPRLHGFARLRGDLDPIELRVDRPSVRLLAVGRTGGDTPVILLFESDDDGRTFGGSRLRVVPTPGWAALVPGGGIVAVDPDRRLLVRP